MIFTMCCSNLYNIYYIDIILPCHAMSCDAFRESKSLVVFVLILSICRFNDKTATTENNIIRQKQQHIVSLSLSLVLCPDIKHYASISLFISIENLISSILSTLFQKTNKIYALECFFSVCLLFFMCVYMAETGHVENFTWCICCICFII